MGRNKFCKCFCAAWTVLFLLLSALPVFAAESKQQNGGLSLPAEESAGRGDTWQVTVRFRDLPQEQISAFRLRLDYDDAFLTLQSITPGEGMESRCFDSFSESARTTAVYASPDRPVSGKDGMRCVCRFSVNEDAPSGSTRLTASAEQLVNSENEKCGETPSAVLSLKIERRLSRQALLKSLKPSAGKLAPAFSPEITDYTLEVPYEVTQLEFDAVAKDNGTVRVNRKNLKKPGEATTFVLTVTSEDGKEKTEYIVTAVRGAKPAGDDASSGTAGKGSASKTTAKKTTKKSSGSSKSASSKSSGKLTGDAGGNTIVYGERTVRYETDRFLPFLLGALAVCVLLLAAAVLLLLRFVRIENRLKKENESKK